MNRSKIIPQKTKTTSGLVAILTLIGVAGRLMPHIPNVTPVGGLATWSGTRLSQNWSYGVIIAVMVISDLFLGFHKTLPYVYVSLILATWIAGRIQKPTVTNVSGVILLNAILFFVVTNFGVWQTTPQAYPHTWAGLMASYTAALPFFRASLLGVFAIFAFVANGLNFCCAARARR